MAITHVGSKILIAGGIAFDKIVTPKKNVNAIGGTGYHAAIAASFLTHPSLISGIGRDFSKEAVNLLNSRRIDTSALSVYADRTKGWTQVYNGDHDLVFAEKSGSSYPSNFIVPDQLRTSGYLLLAALNPVLQKNILDQMRDIREVGIDTKLYVIKHELDALLEVIKRSSIIFLNQEEAIALGGSSNIRLLPERIAKLGPKTVVIKLGGKGSEMFDNGFLVKLPALTGNVVDTTGAGDSFAGAFMGYLAENGNKDQLNFMRAFILGNVMASYNVEGYGPQALLSLNDKDISERVSLSKQEILRDSSSEAARMYRMLYEPNSLSLPTLYKLVSQDYIPGSVIFSQRGSGHNSPDRYINRSESSLAVYTGKNEKEKIRIEAFKNDLMSMNLGKLTSLELIEAILRYTRHVIGGSVSSKTVDPYKVINYDMNKAALEMIDRADLNMNAHDWLVVLSAANALEAFEYGYKDKLLNDFERIISVPSKMQLAIDVSSKFRSIIMETPQNIAFFPDNAGEIVVDLFWIQQLAKKYEELSGQEGKWTIGIIPKQYPAKTDATYDMVQNILMDNQRQFGELNKFIAEGKVVVLDGGPKSQGINVRNLSDNVGDFLIRVKDSNGHIISKGLANMESLSQGINIPAFYMFKVKTHWISRITGCGMGDLAAAYVPAGQKPFDVSDEIIRTLVSGQNTL